MKPNWHRNDVWTARRPRASLLCFLLVMALSTGTTPAAAQPPPFSAETSAPRPVVAEGVHEFTLTLRVAPGHYLYAASIRVAAPEAFVLTRLSGTTPTRSHDPTLGEETDIHAVDAEFVYRVAGALPVPLTVEFQGCSKVPAMCFLPETQRLVVGAGTGARETALTTAPATATAGWRALAARFRVSGKAVGVLPPAEFLEFLDRVEQGRGVARTAWARCSGTADSGRRCC